MQNISLAASQFYQNIYSFTKQTVLCGAVLEGYLLLGTEKTLIAIRLKKSPSEDYESAVVCEGIRFKQIQVLVSYGVVLAICGKRSHVRQYRIPALVALIEKAFESGPIPFRRKGSTGNIASAASDHVLKRLSFGSKTPVEPLLQEGDADEEPEYIKASREGRAT